MLSFIADFTAALSTGEHTPSIVSQGGTATAKCTVNAKNTEKPADDNSLQTGDNSMMVVVACTSL